MSYCDEYKIAQDDAKYTCILLEQHRERKRRRKQAYNRKKMEATVALFHRGE